MAYKKHLILGNDGENKCFYLSTTDEHDEIIVYVSESFKFSEVDVINLIKMCLINARDKGVGKKILSIYRDSTQHRKDLTEKRLKMIGIQNEEKFRPEKLTGKPQFK